MPIQEAEAFVLNTYNFRDADKIAGFYTREFGKIRGVVKGARKAKSRFAAALEMMTRVRIIYYEKENSDLVRLNTCDIIKSYFKMQERLEFSLRIAFMAEILEKFTEERDANPDLFRLVHTVLDEMEKGLEADVGSLYFTLWLLRIGGLLGSLEECAACGTRVRGGGLHYRTDRPGFFCRRCGGPFGHGVPAPAQEGFLEMLRRHPGKLQKERLPASAVKQMKKMLYDLVSTNAEAKLKSLKLLKEMEGNIL